MTTFDPKSVQIAAHSNGCGKIYARKMAVEKSGVKNGGNCFNTGVCYYLFCRYGEDFFQSFPVTAKYNWGFTIFIAALWIVRVTAFFLLCCARYAGVLRAAYKDAGHGCLDRTVRKKSLSPNGYSYLQAAIFSNICSVSLFSYSGSIFTGICSLCEKSMRSRAVNIGYAASAGKLFRIWMQLCAFFEQGQISREQFSVFADPEYTAGQLSQIISGYRCGLSGQSGCVIYR